MYATVTRWYFGHRRRGIPPHTALLRKENKIFDNALSNFGLNKLLKRMLLFIQFHTKLELCVSYDFIITFYAH
jgi:hypothetical protein